MEIVVEHRAACAGLHKDRTGGVADPPRGSGVKEDGNDRNTPRRKSYREAMC